MPTNPMTPKKDTHAAIITEATSMETNRSPSTLIPMVLAVPSPLRRTLNFQDISIKRTMPVKTTNWEKRSGGNKQQNGQG